MDTETEYKKIVNGTGFTPLPKEQRRHGAYDDTCCCEWCSADRSVHVDNPDGVWDTLATDLATGRTWYVHYPELHGKRRKRKLGT